MKQKMRVITLFLLIVLTIAEDVDISKTINSAKEADISEGSKYLLFDYNQAGVYESSKFKRNVTHCSSHAVDTCSSGTTLHHHDKGITNNQNGLALCLSESMEKCLVEHGISLNIVAKSPDPLVSQAIPLPFIPPFKPAPLPPMLPTPLFPPTNIPPGFPPIKCKAVLETCTHVSAQTCYTDPNVSKSVLTACLMPSMNQCMYPTATTSEDVDISKTINSAKEADISEGSNHLLFDYNQAGVYESPKFKRNVIHCSSHAVDACSSGTTLHHHDKGIINNQNGLVLCLSESMEKCLVEHGISLNIVAKSPDPIVSQAIPLPFIPPHKPTLFPPPMVTPLFPPSNLPPIPLPPVKCKTVLETCTHVSAQTCYTDPNVSKSVLAACLMPSMNQCMYPTATTSGNLSTRM